MMMPPELTHESNAPGKILVTGATGAIGGHLAQALNTRGALFAVMCRRPEQREDFAQQGIEAVTGDLTDATSLAAAMVGIEQLFLLAPGGQDQYYSRTAQPPTPPWPPAGSTW